MNDNTPLKPKQWELELRLESAGSYIEDQKKMIEALTGGMEIYNKTCKEFQSRIDELEREKERLQNDRNFYAIQFGDSQQLNETLMGLLEGIIKCSPLPESDWQSYCKEHGLNPPAGKEQS